MIVIDARSARTGGGQTYVRNLLSGEIPEAIAEVTVLAPQSLEGIGNHPRVKIERFPRLLTLPLFRIIGHWSVQRICRGRNADVLFFTGGSVPRGAKPKWAQVTMFRNMLPFDAVERRRYPMGYIRLRLWLLHAVIVKSLRRADHVIMVSDLARDTIGSIDPSVLAKSEVITHGVEQCHGTQSDLVRPGWLPSTYYLYVSNVEPYKRQMEVVQAYSELRRNVPRAGKLLLVGPESSQWYAKRVRREIERLGLEPFVIIKGPVPYDELPLIFHHAEFGIFASTCEACPNALLEAMASGLALVVSSVRPMPEFAGDAALYCDTSDPMSIAAQLITLSNDSSLRRELGRRASSRAANYRWNETTSRTWARLAELGAAYRQTPA